MLNLEGLTRKENYKQACLCVSKNNSIERLFTSTQVSIWHAMTKLERGANKEMCINAVLLMTASHQAATLQLHGNA